ncbi:hypothetical protein MICAF_1130005 [Microcystis aeruginosa PCC 9807]|uniref:Uncharacterized protein n=1 Tax=Microcystis aeruginosa PCC 9807 TaxID=1160283 RepID=I4GZ42_MICAE|nr:hypothetical protein MICAF_1130005 [Microcystis aeruginosa PCC 9807]
MGPKITGNLYRIENRNFLTIISFCAIGLTYIGAIDLCVLCVFVVRFGRSLALYLRIHFTHRLLIY